MNESLRLSPHNSEIYSDAIIVGAGPVGLWQAFQLNLLGLSTQIIDVLPEIGGQCSQLYADKAIYDIPGYKAVTAAQLVKNLHEQLEPFCARPFIPQDPELGSLWQAHAQPFCKIHYDQLVTELLELDQQVQQDHQSSKDTSAEIKPTHAYSQFKIVTQSGLQLRARALFICAGAGAFLAKKPAVPQIENFENKGVFYQLPAFETLMHHKVLIQGDDEVALKASIGLAQCYEKNHIQQTVFHLHRREVFTASPNTQQAFKQLQTQGKIQFIAGQVQQLHQSSDKNEATFSSLASLDIALSANAQLQNLEVQVYCPLLGLSPKLGPIAAWGLALEQKHLPVLPPFFSTEVEGIYASGDIVHYPGKRKLLVTGFSEATMAAYTCVEQLRQAKVILQYTSASKQLQTRLGLE